MIRKPGSVLADHLSSLGVATEDQADYLLMSPGGNQYWAHLLAAGRVYLFVTSPLQTAGSYPALFTLIR